VVGEVKATEGDLLRLYDHFKPGVPEFAALLPPRWAVRLQRWDRARVARGLLPWALPLKIGTHSVGGMLACGCWPPAGACARWAAATPPSRR
jgi:indolepyruvate ferredoxin oxidoreductase beta subunit